MRIVLTSAAVLIAGGFLYAACADNANAGPASALKSLLVANTAVEKVGWRRRYWRNYGVWPTGPRGVVRGDVVVDADDDVVVVSPVRPASCGEYHYWNGIACVDARYNDPYLGRKE
jgi:hypothetical protein